MSEQNKIIQKKVIAAMNKFDWDALSEVMADDIVDSLKNDPFPAAFPDANITILDQIAEGDKVTIRGLCKGTHLGEYKGAAPTGKECSYTYIAIDRIEDGKVVESWLNWDEAGFIRQIGKLS